jgi:Fe-S-cluster containining protein
LLNGGFIKYEHLISIRRGEMARFLDEEAAPIPHELVKIKGKDKDWECIFFDRQNKSCTIYKSRPLECRLLQCWETLALESIAGQNTLTRFDLIPPEHPVMEYILRHELKCPIPEEREFRMAFLRRKEGLEAVEEMTELIRVDLAIRAEAIKKFNIPLSLELFYFGRPIHTLLNAFVLSGIGETDQSQGVGEAVATANDF